MLVLRRLYHWLLFNILITLDRINMMEMNKLKDYQLEIIERALCYLQNDYDSNDLEDLMYSGLELESEIDLILRKIEMYQPKHENQAG